MPTIITTPTISERPAGTDPSRDTGTSVTRPASATATALAVQARAGIEARFLVARHEPRSWEDVRQRALQLARTPRIARAARYAKPTGDGTVQGWSVRWAEEMARLAGHLDICEAVVEEQAEHRLVRVSATDLATNVSRSVDVVISRTVERSSTGGRPVLDTRTNAKGRPTYLLPATEDEMLVKTWQLAAKARRNVILALIPDDILDDCLPVIVETASTADATDPAGEAKRVAALFFALGIDTRQIEELLGHTLDRITPRELSVLRGIYHAVRDGDATWAELTSQWADAVRPETGTKTRPTTSDPTDTPAPSTPARRPRTSAETLYNTLGLTPEVPPS
jgi:hypothetical protein